MWPEVGYFVWDIVNLKLLNSIFIVHIFQFQDKCLILELKLTLQDHHGIEIKDWSQGSNTKIDPKFPIQKLIPRFQYKDLSQGSNTKIDPKVSIQRLISRFQYKDWSQGYNTKVDAKVPIQRFWHQNGFH